MRVCVREIMCVCERDYVPVCVREIMCVCV